jgi:hypothetical protein
MAGPAYSQEAPKPPPLDVSPPAAGSGEPVPEATGIETSDLSGQRTQLNLLGVTDAASGESRRNENVQFNLIDNNAVKELNIRMGPTGTIVEEFRADRGYFSSEYGGAPSKPLHLPSASASGLHGNVYFGHVNSILSSRSFFQVGSVQPARENDYGFQASAPAWRGGSFYFEGSQQKNRGSVNGNVLVPAANERTALATDPATRAFVERILGAYPAQLPNRTDIDPRALNANSPQTIDNSTGVIRLEQTASSRDRVTAEHRFTWQTVEAFQFVKGQNPDTDTKNHAARLTWNRAWSAATSTDFSAGFDRVRSLLVPEKNTLGPTVITGFAIQYLGPNTSVPLARADTKYRLAGQVRQVRGSHTWSAGSEVLRRHINGFESNSHRGSIWFNSDFGRDAVTNVRMGTPSSYNISIGSIHRGFRNWEMQLFAGDIWRVTGNLTLNYGIRFQPVSSPTEVNGYAGAPYPCDCNNIAPRFGFAWRLPGAWGLVRSAYGLDYGEIYPVSYQQVRFNPPENLRVVVQEPDLLQPLRGLAAADLNPNARSGLAQIASELASPYSHEYNFSWQVELPAAWKLDMGYIGSRAHKLLMGRWNNRARAVPGIALTTKTINERRPDQRYFDIRRIENGSMAYFDAAKVTLVIPSWRRLNMEATYWFSKSMDFGGDYSNTATSRDFMNGLSQTEYESQRDVKALSNFDQPHAFMTRFGWLAPVVSTRIGPVGRLFDSWSISSVILAKKGTPFSVRSGSDAPGFGNVDGANGDRPHLLDASILGRTIGNPDTGPSLMPASAFAFIRTGEVAGNLGRNVFRKGGIANINAAVSRTWRLSSEKSITFRVESVNLFNTPQFDEPGRELTSEDFGQITNTLNEGRGFKFRLRFAF